jgi:hypothetical protein
LIVAVYHHDFPHGPDRLTHVANVTIPAAKSANDALEVAWRRTNNVDGSWSRGPYLEDGSTNNDFHGSIERIAPLPVIDGKTYGLRSSMVGDVFEIDGKRWRVADLGFTEIAP